MLRYHSGHLASGHAQRLIAFAHARISTQLFPYSLAAAQHQPSWLGLHAGRPASAHARILFPWPEYFSSGQRARSNTQLFCYSRCWLAPVQLFRRARRLSSQRARSNTFPYTQPSSPIASLLHRASPIGQACMYSLRLGKGKVRCFLYPRYLLSRFFDFLEHPNLLL